MALSRRQLAAFWRLWARALEECIPGASRAQQEAFRRDTIYRICGTESLKEVDRSRMYARLMLEVAQMACDYQAAAYWAQDAERRTAHHIADCARQIGEIAGVPQGWEYCRGTLVQANLPPSWEDIPDTLLKSVFFMLDTHRRRLLRRAGWTTDLGFTLNRSYDPV